LINILLLGLLIFVFGFPAPAISETELKERIVKHLQEVTEGAKIQEPSSHVITHLPVGPDQYRRLADAMVYIVTGEGVAGSGAVISSSFGLIIANRHMVGNEQVVGVLFKPPTDRGKVPFKKEDIFFAQVLKTDSIRDLALLQMVSPPRRMTTVPLGSTSHLQVGHNVFTVGHHKSWLWSYTEGVISQMRPNYEWASHVGTIHRATTIQTHTATSQGSSSGSLFDEDGQFIGVSVGTLGAGLNLAITVDEVREFVFCFLDELRNSPSYGSSKNLM